MQAADYFADGAAIKAVCSALGNRLGIFNERAHIIHNEATPAAILGTGGIELSSQEVRTSLAPEWFAIQVDAVDDSTIGLLDALGSTRCCTQLVMYGFYEDSPGTGKLPSQRLRGLPQLKHLRLDFCVMPQLATLSALTHLTLRDSFDGFDNGPHVA